MRFDPPLIPARLVHRYKRFLADVTLETGEAITVAVPNTGSMMGLTAGGSRVWLSTSVNTKRKYRHSLEIVEADGTLVGINTQHPNRLVEEAIGAGLVDNLSEYPEIRREQPYGQKSRIDLLLTNQSGNKAYVEVKNVHMTRTVGLAEFPDSVTTRGARHLDELAAMRKAGHRAIMVYMIQRGDCDRFSICGDLDPGYAEAFERALKAGVETYALAARISAEEIVAEREIEILLSA